MLRARLVSLGMFGTLLVALFNRSADGAESLDDKSKPARASVNCGKGKETKPDDKPSGELQVFLAHGSALGKSGKKLRLRGDSSASEALLTWLKKPGTDPALRRSLDVTLEKTEQAPERGWSLQDCYPTNFQASKPDKSGGNTEITKIEIAVEHLEPAS